MEAKDIENLRRAHVFIRAGGESREWAAQLAYRKRIRWSYYVPLDEVVRYLVKKPFLTPEELKILNERKG
jgi:hypothetical protein